MSGIICCIANHKGGIGKTTVACNISTALSLQKKKILVIDNDPQSNSTGILIQKNTPLRNSLYELFTDKSKIEDCIYPSIYKNLYIIPNVEETSGLELDFAAEFPRSNFYLKNKIKKFVKNKFDFIFIDCSPSLSLLVSNALHASDCVIIPIDAGSSYSIEGLKKVLNLIATIKETGNPDLRFLRLLINKVDKRTSICQAVIADIEDKFTKDQVFATVIPTNTAFQQAEYLKETIFSTAATSRGAVAYRKLSKEFIKIFNDII